MRAYYPGIDKMYEDLPPWQKELLDERLKGLDNPDKIQPVESLIKVLDEEI